VRTPVNATRELKVGEDESKKVETNIWVAGVRHNGEKGVPSSRLGAASPEIYLRDLKRPHKGDKRAHEERIYEEGKYSAVRMNGKKNCNGSGLGHTARSITGSPKMSFEGTSV